MLISRTGWFISGLAVCALVGVLVLSGGCQRVENRLEGSASVGGGSGGPVEIASEAQAPAPATDSPKPGVGKACQSFAGNILSLPGLVIDDSKDILSADDNLFWLLAAGGGSMILRQGGTDGRITNNFDDHPGVSRYKTLDNMIYSVGGPSFQFAATGIWYLSSASAGDRKNTRDAWTMFEALSVTGAATMGLKLIIDDETPNGQRLAWPSGHTSSSFAVASVLDELYGPQVGIPAYLGAGFVGYRMMDSGDHWASDVLFGAVLGYIVGHHVADKYGDMELAGFDVMPFSSVVADKPVMGLGLFREF